MIKVTIYYENNKPAGMEISGHAGKDVYGHDLVCAAVSAIITGGFNAFQENEVKEVCLEEGYAKISIVQSDESLLKLNMIITQLKTIEDAEPKYLVIK